MDQKSETECQIFGCHRTKRPSSTVEASIKGTVVQIEPCDYHFELFKTMDPALYSVGYTYQNAIEVRLHPAVPATPEPEEG